MTPFLNWRFVQVAVVAGLITVTGLMAVAEQSLVAQYGPEGVAAVAASSPELQQTLSWIIAGGLVVVFFGMMLEGPMVTAAAAFAVSLGYFDVWSVLILATLADLTADVGFYLLGYFSRLSVLEKHGHKVGFTRDKLKKLERFLHTHPTKTIVALKLLPGAAVVGLPLVGAMRVPLGRYATACLSFIVPSALLFTSLGYFFGRAYTSIAAYMHNAEYFILVAVVALLIIYYAFKKATASFAHKLDPAL